jgi:Na+-translocating ferredoxin:NAD+ oxidoreductase subunit G
MTDALRDALSPVVIIVAMGLMLTAAFVSLQPHIEQQRQHRAEKIYFDVLSLPADSSIEFKTITADDEKIDRKLHVPTSIHLARHSDGAIVGLVLSAVAEGYNGPIDLLIGLNTAGTITHVRAVAHRESTDIGDAIDINKNDWIESFRDKSIDDIERIKLTSDGGDIDQITGATVTSRAMAKTVQAALFYFSEHREELLREQAYE